MTVDDPTISATNSIHENIAEDLALFLRAENNNISFQVICKDFSLSEVTALLSFPFPRLLPESYNNGFIYT